MRDAEGFDTSSPASVRDEEDAALLFLEEISWLRFAIASGTSLDLFLPSETLVEERILSALRPS
jgi:hypothetical protein